MVDKQPAFVTKSVYKNAIQFIAPIPLSFASEMVLVMNSCTFENFSVHTKFNW